MASGRTPVVKVSFKIVLSRVGVCLRSLLMLENRGRKLRIRIRDLCMTFLMNFTTTTTNFITCGCVCHLPANSTHQTLSIIRVIINILVANDIYENKS